MRSIARIPSLREFRHCEEHSDEAISFKIPGIPSKIPGIPSLRGVSETKQSH